MTLFALDTAGKQKLRVVHDRAWDHTDSGARTTPTADGDRANLVSGHGLIGCYSIKGGAVALVAASPDGFKLAGKFSIQGEGPSWAHPVVTGGRLYVRYDTHLYGIDVRAKVKRP